ncbi:hypothetical protein P8452_57404 [Trifolium repens]|nr:hypothetical protein P8452_57404 [Trifolium repens]
MREKSRERGREGGKHGKKKFQRNPEVTGYWKVGEVYIPNKLDKAGKRFGFARFEDVDDRQKLLEKIEATWIGTYKIRANLPKFTRGEGFKKPNMNMGTGVVINRGFPKVQTSGKTFKEIALGGSNGNTGIQKE